MKKLLIAVVILILAAAVLVGIFIATFDISLYKGIIISRLEAMTGNRIEIGRLTVGKVKGGIRLLVEDFAMYAGPKGGAPAIVSFDNADSVIDLAALLGRRVRILSLAVLRPKVELVRTGDSVITAGGPAEAGAEGPRKRTPRLPMAFELDIATVDITDGALRFVDMTAVPAPDIVLRGIEARITDITPSGPMSIDAQMAFAGAEQNIRISGRAGGLGTGALLITDMSIEGDLSRLDRAELARAIPALNRLSIMGPLAGLLKIEIRRLELSGSDSPKASASLSLDGGGFGIASLSVPVEDINLSVSWEDNSVSVERFSAAIASGSVSGNIKFDDIFVVPWITLRFAAEIQGVKSFAAGVLKLKQNMDGNMRLTFDGTFSGLAWKDISKTLAGSGEFYLDRGVMVDTNVLNQTLGSLTLFPGLPDMVRGYVPAPIQQVLGNDNTTIEPLRQVYTIEGGYVMIPNLDLRTDTFDLRGEAKSSLTGDISGKGMIRFAQSVSDAMIKSVPEMKYITDSRGQVEFPLSFKAGEEGFKVIPDLKYVGKRVAVQKAGEVVTDFLQKAVNGGGGADGGIAGVLSTKNPKLKDLVKKLVSD